VLPPVLKLTSADGSTTGPKTSSKIAKGKQAKSESHLGLVVQVMAEQLAALQAQMVAFTVDSEVESGPECERVSFVLSI
jgi:cation transporter-like permease